MKEVNKSPVILQLVEIFLKDKPQLKKPVEKCRQCRERIDGFLCAPNQKHVKCKQCAVLMPEIKDRNQRCSVCKGVYCNLYYYECSTGLDFLDNYTTKEAVVPPGCFGNVFEENVMADYLRINKVSSEEMYEAAAKRGVGMVALKSLVCTECAGKVWADAVEMFREEVFDRLPAEVQKRKRCEKGRKCRLQYGILHAQVYSHL